MKMSTYSERSWNSSDDFEDDDSSTSSINRRISNTDLEVNGAGVITTHCVSTVIKPGDKQLHDPLQFVKIKSTELCQKAKEQIKLAEEVKITREKIKEVEEEWQNNLLSWKSKRRQSKKECEENAEEDANSLGAGRKIRTFNEILNEKAKSGARIGYNLHQYMEQEQEEARQTLQQNRINAQITDPKMMNQSTNEQQMLLDKRNSTGNCKGQNNEGHLSDKTNSCYRTSNQTETIKAALLRANEESRVSQSEDRLDCKENIAKDTCLRNSMNVTKKGESRRTFDSTGSEHDDETEEEENESLRLSFKAKLHAFENLAKTDQQIAKRSADTNRTGPVKNKLRMSHSSTMLTQKPGKGNEKTQELLARLTQSTSSLGSSRSTEPCTDSEPIQRSADRIPSEPSLNKRPAETRNHSAPGDQTKETPFAEIHSTHESVAQNVISKKTNMTHANNNYIYEEEMQQCTPMNDVNNYACYNHSSQQSFNGSQKPCIDYTMQQSYPVSQTSLNPLTYTTKQGQSTGQTSSYNYNHWLIQEAELRRQMASRNSIPSINNTIDQMHLVVPTPTHPTNSLFKDDQPLYENAMVYASHRNQQLLKKQQTISNAPLAHYQHSQSNAHNLAQQNAPASINSQYGQPSSMQSIKPPYPNPPGVVGLPNTHPYAGSSASSNLQQKKQKQILSVSGKKKCSNCNDELGRGCAAMVIESLSLYYHINCFRCSVCHITLGNGTCGTDVRVRNHKLHCQNCYSNDEAGLKFSRV